MRIEGLDPGHRLFRLAAVGDSGEGVVLESYFTEFLDGIPVGSGSDVGLGTSRTLRQREASKVRELEEVGEPIPLRVLQRYRRVYATVGIEALIDRRAVRRSG